MRIIKIGDAEHLRFFVDEFLFKSCEHKQAVGAGDETLHQQREAGAWIKQLAAEGISSGCRGGYLCPESYVTCA